MAYVNRNCCGEKRRIYIDCDGEIPVACFYDNIYSSATTRIRLSGSCASVSSETNLSYTKEYRERVAAEKARRNFDGVDELTAKNAMFFLRQGYDFAYTYLDILRHNDISLWQSLYDELQAVFKEPYFPVWKVRVVFSQKHSPMVMPEMMPRIGVVYNGECGYTGMFVYLENGKRVVVRSDEFKAVQIVGVTAEAVQQLNSYKEFIANKKIKARSCLKQTAILRLARECFPRTVDVRGGNYCDHEIIGKVSRDHFDHHNIMRLNFNHSIYAYINDILDDTEKAKMYLKYIFYRLILKYTGNEYFISHPDEHLEYLAYAKIVEEEYGFIRMI